ncbi:cytochrome P450 [Hymenopellis radicata]|nr:cytochrome P450 [Hymenopellis radicata]
MVILTVVMISVLSRTIITKPLKTGLPFPPGPPTWPVVGNILALLNPQRWQLLYRYKQQHGDIVYLHGLGNSVLALNTMEAIEDLLVKRGNIYSHRPIFTVVGELIGLDNSTPLLSYGLEWRAHRKLANIVLAHDAVQQYHSLQNDLAAIMCSDLIQSPAEFFSHIRMFASRMILTVTYGVSVRTADNRYIGLAHDTMTMVSKSTVIGAYLADFLHFVRCTNLTAVKYLPLPFKKDVAFGKDLLNRLVEQPYEHFKRDMAAGVAGSSLANDIWTLEKSDKRKKWLTASLLGAGGEAMYATTLTFIMAMALHRDKLARAQREIDEVIGPGRLPSVTDKPDLPYTNAVILETMRWHPLLPLTLARRTAEDDFYKGFFIPKGTMIIPNVWAIALEPNNKYDPKEFIPERWLDSETRMVHPTAWVYGFGRRICPGRYLAENGLFISIASLLFMFDIAVPPGKELVPEYQEHLISYPKPFECSITPRSPVKAQMAQARAAQCYI